MEEDAGSNPAAPPLYQRSVRSCDGSEKARPVNPVGPFLRPLPPARSPNAFGFADLARCQAFLVSQKMRSISAMRSSAFWPVAGSVDALAAERAFRVSLTSWCSSGYFSKCGGLK